MLKARRNTASKSIPAMKKAGEDTSALMAEMKQVSAYIKEFDAQLVDIDAQITDMLLRTPNLPADDVPVGETDTDNEEIRRWSTPPHV